MLRGGLLPARPYLVVGPSGTGKTTLALEFLLEGVRRGERCLLVTLEEPPNEIRINHRGLQPDLDRVSVFDAIPDVMRYERAPFEDIAAVREAVPFAEVPLEIRRTAELSSVEVTFTALEQTIKMEVARRAYRRIAIDSLTALQYFCMKGVDETLGAQTFLRFLSDLHITTLLTVESPLEDVESPERLLARGEIRLFRWELDGVTVRAIGVEKFRGSDHDPRLHPYRISPRGLDINLEVTISRDTRRMLPAEAPVPVAAPVPAPTPGAPEPIGGLAALEQDAADLAAVGISPAPVAEAIGAALAEARAGRSERALAEVGRARGRLLELFQEYRQGPGVHDASVPARRLIERLASVRTGVPPSTPPPARELVRSLEGIAGTLAEVRPPAPPAPAPAAAPAPADAGPSPPAETPAPASPAPVAPAPTGPPPLPTPAGALAAPARPVPPPGAPRGAPPAATAPTSGLPPSDGPPLPSVPAVPGEETTAAPAPKRRKRVSGTAPKRRTTRRARAPAEGEGAEPKPRKRRTSSRRKAPPVAAAAPGAPPPEEHRVATEGTAPAPSPPAAPSGGTTAEEPPASEETPPAPPPPDDPGPSTDGSPPPEGS